MTFYEMNGPKRADIIRQIAWTLCNSDDNCIHVSNVGREVFEEYGIHEGDLYAALQDIADQIEGTGR